MGHIIGAIGSVLVVIFMVPLLLNAWDAGNTSVQQRLVANHMLMVTQAARQYVNRHQDTLLSQASAAGGPSITVADLIADGFLSDGFQARNAWAQEYQIHIRQPQSGSLQAIVLTTGGRENNTAKFRNVVVPGAAAEVGGAGGYIGSDVIDGQTENTLIGAGRGWVLDLPSVGIASPGAGHLGAVSSYDSSALGQDFLYRVAVPGQPELNAMQTGLDMTDHAISNVSELQFEEREISTEACAEAEDQGRVFLDKNYGLYLCRNNSMEIIGDSGNATLLKNVTVAKNGDKIAKPSCATSTGTVPSIYTSPSLAEAGPEAPPLTSVQTWSTSLSDSEWQVHMRVQTPSKSLDGADEDGWVYPEANYGRILVLTTCAKQTE